MEIELYMIDIRHSNKIMRKSPEKGREEEVRRKQIETTLTELHRLQAEIYDLNIPDNPHSSAPVKKEVKQLTYLYENMIKPKTKNSLNISKQDIAKVINFIEGSSSSSGEGPSYVDSRKLSVLMKEMFGSELEVGLIKKGDSRPGRVTAEQLYEFINYNQFDGFDPIRETYNIFVDDLGVFDFGKYKHMHDLLGLPSITRETAVKETLGLTASQNLSYQKFCEIMRQKQ